MSYSSIYGERHALFFRQALQAADVPEHRAGMPHGFDHVAGAGFTLGADHGGAFADAAQGFAQVAAATHKRHLEIVFVDVVLLIGRRQHF